MTSNVVIIDHEGISVMQVHLRNYTIRKEVIHCQEQELPDQYLKKLENLYKKADLKCEPGETPAEHSGGTGGPTLRSETYAQSTVNSTVASNGRRHLPTLLWLRTTVKGSQYAVCLKPRGEPVQRGELPPVMEPGRIVQIVMHILLALIYLHSRGIAHRDVRLRNVVHFKDRYYLVDLEEMAELNKQPQKEQFGRTAWGLDNAALQNGLFTQASDLYSLGLVLDTLLQPHSESNEQQLQPRSRSNQQQPEQESKKILFLDNLRAFKGRLLREAEGEGAFNTSMEAYDDLEARCLVNAEVR